MPKVEQIDREAAARLLGYRDEADMYDYRTTGEQDRQRDATVQAFARFEASLAPSGLVEAAPVPLTDLLAIRDALRDAQHSRICGVFGFPLTPRCSCGRDEALATIEGLLP